jgi:signal transduction histidine kinase
MVTVENCKLFGELRPAELSALRQIAREQKFSAGQEIFKERDQGDGVYAVRNGLVEISGRVGRDVRLVLSQGGPGDIFGEMSGMERVAPELRQQAKERIGKQVERISDLIGEILDFTQGTQSDFVLAPADYGAFVQQLVKELGPEVSLKSATHGKAHGTGLGLSICKRVVQDHQGWITARGEPGQGAVFSFGLPRRGREVKGK